MAAEPLFPKLVIFGASGPTGRHLVQQALNKGHLISAVVRSPDKFDIRWVYGLLIVFTKVSLSHCSVTGERANVRVEPLRTWAVKWLIYHHISQIFKIYSGHHMQSWSNINDWIKFNRNGNYLLYSTQMIFKTVYESNLNKCFFVPELVGSELKASIGNCTW